MCAHMAKSSVCGHVHIMQCQMLLIWSRAMDNAVCSVHLTGHCAGKKCVCGHEETVCVWTCAVSNACDLEQVTLSTLGRTLTDRHSPAALNI